MMRVRVCLLLGVVVALPRLATAACPPAGTEVPFAKLMNEGFAADYAGCDVVTRAEFFVGRGKASYSWDRIRPQGILTGKVPFQAVPPGESASAAEPRFGTLPHVWVSKETSDVIFTLKRGDPIVLRGGAAVSSPGEGLEFVFVAKTVTKGR